MARAYDNSYSMAEGWTEGKYVKKKGANWDHEEMAAVAEELIASATQQTTAERLALPMRKRRNPTVNQLSKL